VNLMTLQTTLQQLVRGSYEVSPGDEPYIRAVAMSPHLTMVREVVRWWRAYGVGRFCVLTATLLKRRGVFEATISDFVRSEAITPYAEELGELFLTYASRSSEPLLASVAQFELALVRAKKGDRTQWTIAWPCDPHAVLLWLTAPPVADLKAAAGVYATIVSRSRPDMFEVVEYKAALESP